MKRILFVIGLFACVAPVWSRPGPEPVNPSAIPETRALLHRLYEMVEDGKILSGLHHNRIDLPDYWKDLDRIGETSGQEPLIWGGDLAWDAARVVEIATHEYAKGHIVTLMWHVNRPFDRTPEVSFRQQTRGTFTEAQWEELITDGSPMNRMWKEQVDSIASYLKILLDRRIPVLWRPYHEMNGEWFWWGDRKGEDGFVRLWKMLYDRMVNVHHLDNLLWVWNANAPRETPADAAMAYDLYFPGHEYVDVLATDIYHGDWRQEHHDRLVDLADGKLVAIGEAGSLPDVRTLRKMDRFAWFMLWTGFTDENHNSPERLRAVFQDERVVNHQEPKVDLVMEHDWIFSDREPIRVAVSGLQGGRRFVTLSLFSDRKEPVGNWTQALSADTDTLSFPISLADGFYRAELLVDGKKVRERVVGFGDPGHVVSSPDPAADFSDFWGKSLRELASVKPRYKRTLLPEHSNGIRRTYRVEMTSWGGERIYALLCEPVKSGKYPAYITYLGYNSNVWYVDPSANPETIQVIVCTRAQGLGRIPGEPSDFVLRGLEDPQSYYYHGAFLDCVRGVDFVCSRPNVDLNRVFAEGGSQGGAFTIAAAALDSRIRAIAPFVPFLGDFPDYFRIGNWPGNQILPEAERQGIPEDDLYRTLSYFDVKNLAPRVTCPVLMGFGLQDDVCPPHTNFASFNNLESVDKTWVCFPLSGHHVEREKGWTDARNAFFARFDHN